MDFFQSQDVARRKTGLLIFYFLLAVTVMILTLYVVAVGVFSAAESKGSGGGGLAWWRPEILLLVAGGTITVITLGSLYKIFELRAGGEKIAEQLGGRRLHPNSRDPAERRVLNVVEEMALASGTPVPPVYLLDNEPGINAFAAGFSPGDAVIGVNRGTIENLDRDELQGVIAHEFSHILNGDMRLNLRLIGVLHGILLLAIIGYYIIRGGGGGYRSSRRGKGAGQIVLLGLALLVIGYVGLFFARLIKAAVSRQREYLADASAVQFTRNPDGIGGALKKIGSLSAGSRMESPEAESASHMFFGSFRNSFIQAFSTHPPLVERIQRIDPAFDGDFAAARKRRAKKKPAEKKPEPTSPLGGLEALKRPLGALGDRIPVDPVIVMAAVGAPTTDHVAYAHDLLEHLPDALREAVHDPFSVRAVLSALLLDEDQQVRAQQLQIIQDKLGDAARVETVKLAPLVAGQGAAARLPLVEMAESTLQDLSPPQYRTFRETVLELVKANGKISLFEFGLQRILLRRLDQHFRGKQPPAVRYHAVAAVANEGADLLSALAHAGHTDEGEARQTFAQAAAAFDNTRSLAMRSRGDCSLRMVNEALNKLAQCSPAVKKRILNAATVSVLADRVVTVAEGELLRVVADSLDCPMPPLLGATAEQG